MLKIYKRLIVGIILSLLLMSCDMPQLVLQENGQAHPLTTQPQQEGTLDALQGTLMVLQTQVAGLTMTAAVPTATATVTASSTPVPTTAIPTATPIPSSTPTPIFSATPTDSDTPTSTATPILACNSAEFVTDVTVPDYTHFYAGSAFTKIWRLRNSGSCTWTKNYTLAFDRGTSMGKVQSVKLTQEVEPGDDIDISVSLTAPGGNGTYESYWSLKDASGKRFGLGGDILRDFWVKITVGSQYTLTPPASGSCTLISYSPNINSVYSANNELDMRWKVSNTSGITWSKSDVDYRYIGGTKMYKKAAIYDLKVDVTSGATVDIIVDTIAPATRGYYSTTWGIVRGSSTICTLTNTIYVK